MLVLDEMITILLLSVISTNQHGQNQKKCYNIRDLIFYFLL